MPVSFIINRYATCSLEKYMKHFQIFPKQQSFKLLKKLLAMDPKKRISAPSALKNVYFKENPQPTRDAFSCFDEIPFPLRQYLPKKNVVDLTTLNSKLVSQNAHTKNSENLKLSA